MKTHSSSWLINKYVIDKKTFFTLPYLKFIKELYKARESEKKQMLTTEQINALIKNVEKTFVYFMEAKNVPQDLAVIRKNFDHVNQDLNILISNYEKEFGKTRNTLLQRSVFEKSTLQLKEFIHDVVQYKDKTDNFIVEKNGKYKDFSEYAKKLLCHEEFKELKKSLDNMHLLAKKNKI